MLSSGVFEADAVGIAAFLASGRRVTTDQYGDDISEALETAKTSE